MTNTTAYKIGYLLNGFVIFLIPFFIVGWTGRTLKFLPRGLAFEHSAAHLFTGKVSIWWEHHLEGERRDGSRFEIEEREFFPMGASGYRTRLDRILTESNKSRQAVNIRFRLANYVAMRWREKGYDPDDLVKLRLVRSLWKVGTPELANPVGHWDPPPITSIGKQQRLVLGEYIVTAGKAEMLATVQTASLPIDPKGGRALMPEDSLPPSGRLRGPSQTTTRPMERSRKSHEPAPSTR
jgi:hypothetical protein